VFHVAVDPHRQFYEGCYSEVFHDGCQGWGSELVDRQVERFTIGGDGTSRILEIGAGSGEHLKFVRYKPRWTEYVALDLTPRISNPETAATAEALPNFRFVAGDAANVPFDDNYFDLVISTCVLAHVAEPEQVFMDLRRVTKSGGRIVIGMPCDPGFVNQLFKRLLTYRVMKRAGVPDPKLDYARQHRNPIHNLLAFANHVFRDDDLRVRYFPFRIPSWNLNVIATLVVDVT